MDRQGRAGHGSSVLAVLGLLLAPVAGAQHVPLGYGGTEADTAADAVRSPDGRVLVAGYTSSFGDGDPIQAWLLAVEASGEVAWDAVQLAAQGSSFHALLPADSGGWLVAGRLREGSAVTDHYGWLGRFDQDGALVWQRKLNSTDNATGFDDLERAADGGVFVGGNIGSSCPLVLKTDPAGELVWQRCLEFGGMGSILKLESMAATPDGGLVTLHQVDPGPFGDDDLCLAKFDESGGLEWGRWLGTDRSDYGWRLTRSDDGGFFLAAGLRDETDKIGASVVKVDSLGRFLWRWSFWGPGLHSMDEVLPLPSGGVLAAIGQSFEPPGAVLVRLDANGTVRWLRGNGDRVLKPARLLPSPDGRYVLAGTARAPGRTAIDVLVAWADDTGTILGGCWPGDFAHVESVEPIQESAASLTVRDANTVAWPATTDFAPAEPLAVVEQCPFPEEVPGLLLSCEGASLAMAWSEARNAEEYEVYAGTLPARTPLPLDHDAAAACGIAELSTMLAGECSAAGSRYFLVRGVNALFDGPLGFDSSGEATPAPAAPCP